MMIAILGFGHLPPAHNLELAAVAAEQIAAAGLGVAVGSLKGTFATAIDVAAKNGAPTLAVVDATMAEQPHPATTEIVVVDPNEKHQRIAQIASAGLVLGGAEGTRKLAAQLLAVNKTLVAVRGTGGAVDDGSLPSEIAVVDSVDEAIELVLAAVG